MANNTNNKKSSQHNQQHNRLDTLYSTVNKSTRTQAAVNSNGMIDECDYKAALAEKQDHYQTNNPNIKVIN